MHSAPAGGSARSIVRGGRFARPVPDYNTTVPVRIR